MSENCMNEILPFYKTNNGKFFLGTSETLLSNSLSHLKSKVKLVFTSPPFPLNRKKRYGNQQGDEYVKWLSNFAKILSDYICEDGSIVLEVGNAWEPKLPTMSTLSLEALLEFKRAGSFYLCQEFVYYNPARLPTPVQWVNKERVRVKDAFTKLWWFSKIPRPDADNRRVLIEYSDKMKKLLSSKVYNSGHRPSQHRIGEKSFLTDNGGSIPPNVIIASNTTSSDQYISYCKSNALQVHPARMHEDLPKFFIKFLSQPNDIVLDPFAGSNITGSTAEALGRNWISIEAEEKYAKGSIGRFLSNESLVITRDFRDGNIAI
jgi:site-specific DNA-methyltransferase (cytosine-N4-specific)